MSQTPFIIIGSGLAGYSLVKELRAIDTTQPILLITADQGDYYSKPQLSTAFAHNKLPSDLVMQTAAEMAEKHQISIMTETRVTQIDKEARTVTVGDKQLAYDKLILALGAEKLLPPLEGDGVDDILSVNTLEDYARVREAMMQCNKICILGAGLVGCEFANDWSQAGFEMQIIAPDTFPCMRFVPEHVGVALKMALSEIGVTWHLSRYPAAVRKTANGYQVVMDNGQSISAELVLSAVGLRPSTHLAQAAGLRIHKGIMTNSYCQTSDPNIYALGDCAEVDGSVRLHIAPLLTCARALAKTLTGSQTAVQYPVMPIIVKTPTCPISTLLTEQAVEGEWLITGEGIDIEAQFKNEKDELMGFCLSGNAVKRRGQLMKSVIRK